MSIVNATYDTVSKKLDVSHDGDALPDVHEVSFYHNGKNKDGQDMHQMSVRMRSTDEENDVQHIHALYAKKYEDLKVQDKIANFFTSFFAPKK